MVLFIFQVAAKLWNLSSGWDLPTQAGVRKAVICRRSEPAGCLVPTRSCCSCSQVRAHCLRLTEANTMAPAYEKRKGFCCEVSQQGYGQGFNLSPGPRVQGSFKGSQGTGWFSEALAGQVSVGVFGEFGCPRVTRLRSWWGDGTVHRAVAGTVWLGEGEALESSVWTRSVRYSWHFPSGFRAVGGSVEEGGETCPSPVSAGLVKEPALACRTQLCLRGCSEASPLHLMYYTFIASFYLHLIRHSISYPDLNI